MHWPAGTLAVCGDMKQMDARWLRGASLAGYGVSLSVGIGIPIPILDEETIRYCALSDADLVASVVDYSTDYPNCISNPLGTVTYKELKSGTITVQGKQIATAGLSSYARAKEIATELKDWIRAGKFELSQPVAPIPGPDSGLGCPPLVERPVNGE